MNMTWVLLAATLVMCSAMTIGHDDLEEEETSEDGNLPGDPMFVDNCKVCKWVMKKVKKSFTDPSDVEKLTQKLHSICDKIPFGKEKCKKYVHKYFLMMVQDFVAELDVETICVDVKMCKPKEISVLSY